MLAWDRCLLSCAQHLTLFISGLRGTYPLIGADGVYTANATRHSVALRFQVGLGGRYKPGKEAATEAARTFGWIGSDAEEELWKQKEKSEEEMYQETNTKKKEETEERENVGRFDRFSLSSSLESLMDQSLLRLIQIRRKFSLGWAGAEALLSEVEKSQKRPEDIFDEMNRVCGTFPLFGF
jgi:ubiquitin-conjugating enzyme E2 Q